MKKIYSDKIKPALIYVVPLIILLFILLIFWPGIFTVDGDGQWHQVTANNISNAHPFFSTYFLLLLSKIWNSKTIQLVFQIIMFSIIWGTICKEFINESKNKKIIIIYTVLLCLFPIISLYAITLWKDVLYSYYLLAISYLLYVGSKKNFEYSKLQYVVLGILLFLVFSYRHNGIIVAVLLMLLLMIVIFKNKSNIKKGLIIVLTFGIVFGVFSLPKKYYLDKYRDGVSEPTASTLDNYIGWMMGAHLLKGYVDDDDLEFLNKYIELNEWKEAYNPFIINNTNLASTRDEAYLVENQEKFRKIFLKYSIKHPSTIIIHYLKADALLWSPFPIGYVYQYDFKAWGPNYGFGVRESSFFPELNNIYEKFLSLTMRRPIRVILYQPATIMYICIILVFILSKCLKNKKLWIVLTPMLFNVVSLLPINLAQDLRYVYINYLTFAFVILLFILNFGEVKLYLKNVFNKKKQNN